MKQNSILDKYRIEITPRSVFIVIMALVLAWLVFYLRSIVVLLFASYITFAGLNPIVEKLEGVKIKNFTFNKQLSISIVFFAFLSILSLIIWAIIGPTYEEAVALIEDFDTLLNDSINRYNVRELLGNDRFEEIQAKTVEEVANFANTVTQNPERILDVGRSIASALFNLITFVSITFYQLTNPTKIRNFIISFFDDKTKAKKILGKVEDKLGAWLQGQITLMVIMGLISYIGFSLIGIPFALPLSIMVAFLDIIPVIGPIVAFIPTLIVTLALGEPWQVVALVIFYLLLQQAEGNILVPKIMEQSVGLDPVLVIVAIMAGSSLMGVAGAIFAIPFSAILIILYQEWIYQKNINQINLDSSDKDPLEQLKKKKLVSE